MIKRSFTCEQCSSDFIPKHAGCKNRYCSRSCRDTALHNMLREEGELQKERALQSYQASPKLCLLCQGTVPYSNRSGQFCSRTCAAKFRHTKWKDANQAKVIKTRPGWSVKCLVTGEVFHDINLYRNRDWVAYPKNRIQTIKVLADTFSIKLGTPCCISKLNVAKECIRYHYHDLQMTSSEVHAKFNFPFDKGFTFEFLRRIGIQLRSQSESAALNISNGRNHKTKNKYKCGYHTDIFGTQHYYRSSYELKYYQKLDDLNIRYQTESIRVEYYDSHTLKIRNAVPDIIIDDLIIEIKSTYTYDRQNMADRFKAYQLKGYAFILNLEGKDYVVNHVDDLP